MNRLHALLPRAAVVVFAGTALCGAAQGQSKAPSPRVVELFTSQGCPKCPPADRLIAEFAKEPGTIALSFAVNYWDYIGWKDTLASPAFTARQHAYAAARGDRQIFTPQVIVNGVGVEAGADKAAILRDMERAPAPNSHLDIPVSVTETAGQLRIDVGGRDETPASSETASVKSAGIYVLRVARQKTVEIDRGENSGRSVTYTNAVRAMTKIGDWTGTPARFDILELKGDDEGYVVLIQAGTKDKPGAILAAAKSSNL